MVSYPPSKELDIRAQQLGDRGAAWLADLPDKIRRLQKTYNLKLGQALGGGTESLVITAESDWGPCVLKLGLPDNLQREALAYRLADGRGYARLHTYDADEDSLIVEALGGMLVDAGLSVDAQISHLVSALEASWQVQPSPDGLMSGADKAQWHIDYVRPHLDHSESDISRAHIELALRYAQERQKAHASAHEEARCVLSHGDGHAWNALAASGDLAYRFVDPDGQYAEPAYDLAILMREWVAEMLDGDVAENGVARCQALSERTGETMRAIWQWGFVEQASTYLMLLELNWPDVAKQHLAVLSGWAQVRDFN